MAKKNWIVLSHKAVDETMRNKTHHQSEVNGD
jgi:hypothetical protein